MATEIVSRPVSADAWQRALTRALSEGLDVLVCEVTGAAYVESSSRPGRLHAVSVDGCSCEAGRHGRVCKHQACYRVAVGLLELPEVIVPCSSCASGRIEEWGVSGPIGSTPCTVCGGSGLKPDHRLAGLPSVEVVAVAA